MAVAPARVAFAAQEGDLAALLGRLGHDVQQARDRLSIPGLAHHRFVIHVSEIGFAPGGFIGWVMAQCRVIGPPTQFVSGVTVANPTLMQQSAQGILAEMRHAAAVRQAADIDPNYMDATFVVSCADWIMAELVRLLHNVSVDEAQKIVDSLVTKQIPVIWQIGDHHRVLSPPGKKLSTRDKILLLLYNANPSTVSVGNLLKWTEYGNSSRFRTTILTELHKDDLIHVAKETDEVHLSPFGIKHVEEHLPLDF